MTSTKTKTKPKAEIKRRGRTPKYPWADAARMYIEGVPDGRGGSRLPTLSEVATELDIPQVRVREKSAVEHWAKQRENMQIELAAKRQKARIRELSAQGVEFDASAFQTAKLGLGLVQARIVEISQEFAKKNERKKDVLARLQAGEEIDDLDLAYSSLDARELETLGRAAETWQRVGNNALGKPVGALRHEHTGEDGGPIEVAVDVTAELAKDDPKRLAEFWKAAARAGLQDLLESGDDDDDEILDADVVDEDDGTLALEAG